MILLLGIEIANEDDHTRNHQEVHRIPPLDLESALTEDLTKREDPEDEVVLTEEDMVEDPQVNQELNREGK